MNIPMCAMNLRIIWIPHDPLACCPFLSQAIGFFCPNDRDLFYPCKELHCQRKKLSKNIESWALKTPAERELST